MGTGRISPFAWITGASRSGTSSPRACVGDIGPLGREGSPRSALDGETGRGPAKQALMKKISTSHKRRWPEVYILQMVHVLPRAFSDSWLWEAQQFSSGTQRPIIFFVLHFKIRMKNGKNAQYGLVLKFSIWFNSKRNRIIASYNAKNWSTSLLRWLVYCGCLVVVEINIVFSWTILFYEPAILS